MENLHAIASRKFHAMAAANEDTSDTKIVVSPVKTSNVIQSDTHNRSLSDPMGGTPTPIPRVRKDYNESSLFDIDVSGLSIALAGTGNDRVYSELRRAEDHQRGRVHMSHHSKLPYRPPSMDQTTKRFAVELVLPIYIYI